MTTERAGNYGRLRRSAPPTVFNKFRRVTWRLVESSLYRWSPVWLHGWRCWLLRVFGASVGPGVHSYPTARIWAPWNLRLGAHSCLGPHVNCYSVGKVAVGDRVVVSQGVHLCSATHDYRVEEFTLLVGDIEIAPLAWIAADAFIGPGVVVGERAVVGARAVVMRDVKAGSVVAGNPASFIRYRSG